jgi:hypothetical protein
MKSSSVWSLQWLLVQLPERSKNSVAVKGVTLNENRKELSHILLSVLTDWIWDFIFSPPMKVLKKLFRLPGDEPNPSRAVFGNLLILHHHHHHPSRAYFHFPYVVASLTSVLVIPAFKFRSIGNLFKEAWPSGGKGAYLIKDDGINKYGIVEIQLHAFSVSVLDCDKWLGLQPSHFKAGDIPPVANEYEDFGTQCQSGGCGEGKSIFCCWKLNHNLRSTWSSLPTGLGTPGVQSSENPYVNTSSAFELVERIKHRRASVAVKHSITS